MMNGGITTTNTLKKNDTTQHSPDNKELSQDFSFKVEYTFLQEPYICIMKTPKQNSLFLSVERQSTSDQWIGEFSVQDIENITSTTRNYKKFRKFVQMLYEGLKRTSNSVTLELLTRSQLEIVCQKNFRRRSGVNGEEQRQSLSLSKDNSNQRYLDMVYHVEYDTVHYPLPLTYVKPDSEKLKRIVQTLREENAKLRDEIISTKTRAKHQSANETRGAASEEYEKLKKEHEKLKRDHKNLKHAFEKLEKDSNFELRDVKKEYENLTADYVSQRDEIQNLKHQVENSTSIQQYTREIYRLKKLIASTRDEIGVKEQLLKKKDDELALFREDLMNIAKSEKKLRAECDRLNAELSKTSKRKSATSVSKSSAATTKTRGRSLSPGARRPSSAPKSFTRFDPTQYIADKKSKTKSVVINSKKLGSNHSSRASSRESSRSSSVERSRSRDRDRRLSSGSESEKRSSRRSSLQSTRPSAPTKKSRSRSPRYHDDDRSRLDPEVLKSKLSKLTTRKPAIHVPKPVKRTSITSAKTRGGYASSDYRTSDDSEGERTSRVPTGRSKGNGKISGGGSSRYSRRTSRGSTNSNSNNMYDTSDSDYD